MQAGILLLWIRRVLLMVIHLCVGGASEKPTHGPQFTLGHLTCFFEAPVGSVYKMACHWFSGVPAAVVYQEALVVLHLDFCLFVVFETVLVPTLIMGAPANFAKWWFPKFCSCPLKLPPWFLYFSAVERVTVLCNFVVFSYLVQHRPSCWNFSGTKM